MGHQKDLISPLDGMAWFNSSHSGFSLALFSEKVCAILQQWRPFSVMPLSIQCKKKNCPSMPHHCEISDSKTKFCNKKTSNNLTSPSCGGWSKEHPNVTLPTSCPDQMSCVTGAIDKSCEMYLATDWGQYKMVEWKHKQKPQINQRKLSLGSHLILYYLSTSMIS